MCDFAVGLSRMVGGRVMPSESKLIKVTNIIIIIIVCLLLLLFF